MRYAAARSGALGSPAGITRNTALRRAAFEVEDAEASRMLKRTLGHVPRAAIANPCLFHPGALTDDHLGLHGQAPAPMSNPVSQQPETQGEESTVEGRSR